MMMLQAQMRERRKLQTQLLLPHRMQVQKRRMQALMRQARQRQGLQQTLLLEHCLQTRMMTLCWLRCHLLLVLLLVRRRRELQQAPRQNQWQGLLLSRGRRRQEP
mmetsp:Transcript_34289/g.66978  ORF Transcript_34289/g.66978 Transcript_34289/m.66978 type:complete len:105 (+) Transcript_34289:192-506(+)